MLLVLTMLIISWFAYEMWRAAERRGAIVEIERLGGECSYWNDLAPQSPRWFSLLRNLYGDKHLGYTCGIYFPDVNVQDPEAALVHMRNLTMLIELDLSFTPITDAGLVHVSDLTQLKYLYLRDTHITDAGLVHLKGLTGLESLRLGHTKVTDAGLVHLKNLTKLGYLELFNTRVTEEGVKKLKQALPNCNIRD
jgi:hypothetical protein